MRSELEVLKEMERSMEGKLRELKWRIGALRKAERPALFAVPSEKPDCSKCQYRLCEKQKPCPDGYAGLMAKRAAGRG